jgi:hypothetical protein
LLREMRTYVVNETKCDCLVTLLTRKDQHEFEIDTTCEPNSSVIDA